MKANRKEDIQNAGSFMKYTSMAIQMIGAILVCVFLGRFLDGYFVGEISKTNPPKSFPLFTFVGTILGVASSLYLALKSLKK